MFDFSTSSIPIYYLEFVKTKYRVRVSLDGAEPKF